MGTTTLRLRSPGELITAIPYLLGFEPTRSLVVVALKDGRLGLTSRIDLPDPGEPGRAARVLMPALRRERPGQVILIGYGDTPGHAAAVLDAFAAALQGAGIGIRDRLLVTGGRWRSLDCTDPGCCPPEGTPIGRSRAGLAVASEFVGQGIAPLPDRAALAALLEPTDQARVVGLLLSRPRRVPQPRVIGGLWARILDVRQDQGLDPADITVQDAAWAARTLRDVALRDGIIVWLTPGTLELPELPEHVRGVLTRLGPPPGTRGTGTHAIGGAAQDSTTANTTADATANTTADATADPAPTVLRLRSRLIRLATLLPDPHAAPALTVLAAHAWWHGNGALANVALARALRADPGYRLAQLIQLMLDEGIQPDHP
ncbi:hypothetical protein N865_20010 [Intrasporangium oryzae NRRL B-24470]|uniref:DUF4192 domain-containing protein n=1 Tax=Intrasporangium oryzae NRRL B-24470 TaxID=1386089 RepID=W9G3K5_9MICO|nr:DUF4192 domain-containing protein [Intrasporangium oryzae]EWS99891.1 hypothetical protein N865_20010 [Intrasporangium oryzae NRRL B-24470]